jgi:eukaryotic-like serine/threonine-protein kinase
MKDCLSIEELERVAESPADCQGPERLSHLESCPACQAQLVEIRENLNILQACRQLFPNGLSPGSEAAPEAPGSFADPSSAEAGEPLHPMERPRIEGYDLIQEIHRGAQGVVYKAVQSLTHRTVAIKVMLQGPFASRRMHRRFEREIELVAALEHPNIVRLYSSGQADGRRFFAMEYIDGLPLRDHVVASQPAIRDLLGLFVLICRAVAYAHARGVIHRDLKPGNILVDRNGQPHVLDFGLAKPIDTAGSGVDTHATLAGEFYGTLAYASPEQASCRPEAVDVRTDVYALGMILYELISGGSPYPTTGSISQIIAHIMETEPRKLTRYIPGLDDDIDTIVRRALEKDPNRRYQSVDALASDIERYLAGRPIESRPYSIRYVLRKAVIRHKAAAMGIATVFVSAILIALLAILGARNTAHERDRALAAERKAHAAEELARKEAYEAQRNLYFTRINVASNAYTTRDVARMRLMLQACPARFRAWEWYRLRWLNDASLVTFTYHPDTVSVVRFLPDARQVASGDLRGNIKIWDPMTGHQASSILAHDGPVRGLDFSPDGRQLVSAGEDNQVHVWDLPSGKIRLSLHPHPASCAAFSPDGQQILTAEPDALCLWQAARGEITLRIQTPGISLPVRAGFSPDGKRVVSVHDGGKTVKEWDPADGRLLSSRDNPYSLLGLTSKLLYPAHARGFHLAEAPGGFKIIDDVSGRDRAELLGHVGPVHYADVSADGTRIVTGSDDQTCRVWDSGAIGSQRVWDEKPAGVQYAVYSPDGRRIATAGRDGTLKIWRADGGRTPLLSLRAHTSSITSIAFSPDGSRLVSAPSGDNRKDLNLKVWDSSTGQQVGEMAGHTDGISCVEWLPQGSTVVSAGWDATVRIWDVETGRCLHAMSLTDEIWDLAVSRDGRWIAAGGKDQDIYLWEAGTARLIQTLHEHIDTIDALTFSPDSRSLFSGDNDGILICWDIPSGRQRWKRDCECERFYSATCTPDGKRLLTATGGSISIWDTATGLFIMSWGAHQGASYSLGFSPDGRNLLSMGSKDLTFKVWPSSDPKGP